MFYCSFKNIFLFSLFATLHRLSTVQHFVSCFENLSFIVTIKVTKSIINYNKCYKIFSRYKYLKFLFKEFQINPNINIKIWNVVL